MTRYRYPRTPHLPDSPGRSDDDEGIGDTVRFDGVEVVVTEKLDGECTTLYPDGMHARSPDGRHHQSQSLLRAWHAGIAALIPSGWRACGENLYARHSIPYDALPAFFFVFAVYNQDNLCLSWDDTVAFADGLGAAVVPVLYRGLWDSATVAACYTGKSTFAGSPQEGYVVRPAAAFQFAAHAQCVAKWVRAGHVQTDEHWRTRWTPNHLAERPAPDSRSSPDAPN